MSDYTSVRGPQALSPALAVPAAAVEPDLAPDAPETALPSAEAWLERITAALKRERPWRREARMALDRYRLESGGDAPGRFNILWANTETLRNAVYNQPPRPDIRQRWETKDPVALAAAEVLDRALTYTLDTARFDYAARRSVLDLLLPGRAVLRVRYNPTIITETDMYGAPFELVRDETILFEPVPWDDFTHADARGWEHVDWVAFRHWVSREDAKRLFPDFARDLTYAAPDSEMDDEGRRQGTDTHTAADARAQVWEVWDRRAGCVVWVSRGIETALAKTPPTVALEGFFPVARPLLAVEQPDALEPVALFSQYSEQAAELDTLTSRIGRMARVVKWRGLYDASLGDDIARAVRDAADGELVPTDKSIQWLERGGLSGAIWTMPLEAAVSALKVLYESRERTKAVIYEITGISDIIRGVSDPGETATAQQIKASWGSSRVDGMKREIQRFFRDTLAIAAEIMAEAYQPETLAQMTGSAYPPELWGAVVQVLRSDKLRAFKVDIETDSTIAPNQQAEMKSLSETMQMLGGLLGQVVPGVQSGVVPPDLALSLLSAVVRKTPLANEMTAILQQYEEELKGGNPMKQQLDALKKENEQLKMEARNRQGELQLKGAELQQKAQNERAGRQLEAAELRLKGAELQQNALRPPVVRGMEQGGW